MKEDYLGEKFLNRLYKDMYLSEEVQHTSKKGDGIEETIKKYMDRLERIHNQANTESKKNLLKSFYFRKYIIKEENIPFWVNKKEIIDSQKKRLSMWIDYLTDDGAMYPMWAKYWAFQGMLKLGTYDEAREVYQRRSEKTLAPFVEANPEIISNCIYNMMRYLESKETINLEMKPLLESGSFKKLYEYYEKKFKLINKQKSKSTQGIWIKYNYKNRNDALKLAASLENRGTKWCTANESMSINQICGGGGYVGGDFYVYYTLDDKNEYTIPRIAIRMNETKSIGEIRGVGENQNLEEEMMKPLESKLKEMSFLDDEERNNQLVIINDLKELYQIHKKTVYKIDLSEEEIILLYTKKYGFGWENDPMVKKIIDLRDIVIDLDRIKDLNDKCRIISKNINIIPKTFVVYDKQFMLRLLEYDINAFKFGSEELKNDKEIVLSMIKKKSSNFKSLGERFKNDRQFVLSAVKQNGLVIQHISDEFKLDREIILEAIKENFYAFEFVSEKVKNRELILEIVKQNGLALEFVSEEFKHDREIALSAIKQNGCAIQYASEEIKNDREIVLEIVRQNGLALGSVSEKFRNDREFVLLAIKQNGNAIQYASERLKNDREIVLTAIKKDASAICYASERLKNDREIVLEAVKKDGKALFNLSKEIRNDKEIALAAVKQNGFAIINLSKELKKDKEIIIEAIKENVDVFSFIDDDLKKDQVFILYLVNLDVRILEYVDESFKNDIDFMLKAVKNNMHAIKYVSENLRNNKNFVIEYIKIYYSLLDFTNMNIKELMDNIDAYIMNILISSNILVKDYDLINECKNILISIISVCVPNYEDYVSASKSK